MQSSIKRLLLLWVCLNPLFLVEAQTTKGRDFWLAIPRQIPLAAYSHRINQNEFILDLFIQSESDSWVIVETPLQSDTLQIRANESLRYEVSYNKQQSTKSGILTVRDSTGISSNSIHIYSQNEIGLSVLNNSWGSADAALLYPSHLLGSEYILSTYDEDPTKIESSIDWISTSSKSQLLVIATKDHTVISITTSQNTLLPSLKKGNTYEFTLDKGEVLFLDSELDLSGTTIISIDECKPIAVFGGNEYEKVTGGQNCAADWSDPSNLIDPAFPLGLGADFLFSQNLPTRYWGKEYIALPFAERTGYVLQIVAKYDNTEIKIGSQKYLVNKMAPLRIVENTARSVTSDKPIAVTQLSQSLSCDYQPIIYEPTGIGDPFMLQLVPSNQMAPFKNFINHSDSRSSFRLFASVLVKTDEITQFSYISTSSPNIDFKIVQDDPEYSYATFEMNYLGANEISSLSGLIGYVYAFSWLESFGYPLGSAMQNQLGKINLQSEQIGIIDDKACINDNLQIEVLFDLTEGESPFNEFEWFLGDGNTKRGSKIEHLYSEPGQYLIKLIASKGDGDCRKEEIFYKQLEIVDIGRETISGPQSVCPNLKGFTYSLKNTKGNNYHWEVIGGEITRKSNNNDSITVSWFDSNKKALVKVIETNSLGCSAEQTLKIIINEELRPPAPQRVNGPDNLLCPNQLTGLTYFTPPSPGAEYQWFVEGGDIIGSSTQNMIKVNWNSSSVKKIWFEETNSLSEYCKGVSDTLNVSILDDLVIKADINSISCKDAEDGQIKLQISGGLAPYLVEWDDGTMTIDRYNLKSDSYQVRITDSAGCTLTQSIHVSEPNELSAEIDIYSTFCYGENNGYAKLLISGGSSPYKTSWNNGSFSPDLFNKSLGPGPNTVKIVDKENCELVLNFHVDEPKPLTITTTDTPSCIGQSTGTISVEASGGTSPYTYRWNTSPPQDSQLIRGLPAGKYSVTVTDANGCSITFNDEEIFEKPPFIIPPNVFSPNGDGINDTFLVVSDCSIELKMFIYSKWGELIFKTTDVNNGWDGRFNGSYAPVGQYSYIISYKFIQNGENQSHVKRGNFQLIR